MAERKFPQNFKWCVATASYQIEGGWNSEGKGLGIWDTFCHKDPSPIKDSSNGNEACDSYHNYERDVQMISDLGVKFYRFSFSWPRLLPKGTTDCINKMGVQYYQNLIQCLIENGIEPVVTLYHWDLPQALQDRGGWLNRQIIQWFADYARFCFETFGSKVKHWITINEPWVQPNDAYGEGVHAPGLKGQFEWTCYLVAHHELLAHAQAYKIYDQEFRKTQKGRITVSLNCQWYEPASDSPEDKEAADRAVQFEMGWFSHPIFSSEGDYPSVMKEFIGRKSKEEGRVTSRLPELTSDEIELLRGSADFFALNHYFAMLVRQAKPDELPTLPRYHQNRDSEIVCFYADDWYKYAGTDEASAWVRHTPWGLRKVLNYIKSEYNNPTVFISENGCPTLPDVGLDDQDRIQYFNGYLGAILDAIEDGCNIEGYTAWTLMDNFEWAFGYTLRFGLYQVDFNDPEKKRTAKESAKYFSKIVKQNAI